MEVDELLHWLRDLVSDLVGAEADGFLLGAQDDLFEIGLDELDIARIVASIEHCWGVRLGDDVSVAAFSTLAELAAAVRLAEAASGVGSGARGRGERT
jgi:aryl carrier-like protein